MGKEKNIIIMDWDDYFQDIEFDPETTGSRWIDHSDRVSSDPAESRI